jgi:hypothetical protein
MPEMLLPTVDAPTEPPDERAAREILQRMTQAGVDFVNSQQWCFDRLWKSPDASAAQILAKIGPRAVELFLRGRDAVDFITGAHSGRPIASMEPSEYTPPVPYTAHPDGTITINQPNP